MFKQPPKKITSLTHPLVKHLVKARENRCYREEVQKVVVPGLTLFREISLLYPPTSVLVDETFPTSDIEPTHFVTKEILKKITGLSSPEGIVAEFPLPPSAPLEGKKFILILDQLTDPGNLGTLLRSALSFGWEGIYLLPGSVDPFNDKVLRSSRGACFKIPYFFGNWETLFALSQRGKIPFYLADLEGTPIEKLPPPASAFLVLGNESQGLSKTVASLGQKITIPISHKMESLNVAVAGSILMYLMRGPHAR